MNYELLIEFLLAPSTLITIIIILIITNIISYVNYKDVKANNKYSNEMKELDSKLFEATKEMNEELWNKYRRAERELFKLRKEKLISEDYKIKVKKTKYAGKKVIIGSYNYEIVADTRKLLVSMGMDVDIAYTGDEIINRIIEDGEHFDLILTNNTYREGRSGKDMTEVLKREDNFNIPIVVYTIERNSREKFLEYGYDEFLAKPLEKKELIEVLEKLNI